MEPRFEVNSDAVEELPDEVSEPLRRFLATRAESELAALVRAALNDVADAELPAELSDEARLIEDVGLDSLTITEFVFFFEDVFGLKITNADMVGLRTVGELKRFLSARLIG